MNPQEKILDDICKVSKQLIQSKINPLIDQLVITKINQETEKFFESVNIFGDIFPKPEGSVLFRFCGSCCKCKWDGPFYQGISYSHEQWKKECESVYRSPIYKHETYDTDIYTDEYILLCSFSPVNNDWKTLYTNYGRLCSINHQFTHIYTPSTQMNMCVMDYTDGCGRNKPILSDKINIKLPLTIEYINMLAQINFIENQNFNTRLYNKLIHNYKTYNLKASEVYKIQKEKEQIQEMMKELQEKETNIVTEKASIKIAYSHIKENNDKLELEKEFLKEKIDLHKQKSRNLLKRENIVFNNESLKSCHQELKDISLSLSDMIDLTEHVDPALEERLSQTIQKLNTIYKEDEEEIVVEAEEI